MGQTLLEREDALEEVLDWEAGLQALHARIAHRFSRSESRQRVLAYLEGLLGSVERKNGWQLAEYAGDATPDGVQRLLAVYHWDEDQVRDDLQGYVVEHLGDPAGVLVVDETGFLKQGKKSVGVKRQYSGTAGKVENCQIGVFLAYGSRRGAAFLDRDLYLPQEWAADCTRRQEAGVPQDVVFRTKAQLAQGMIARAVGAGVPFAWVTGDTVYGNDRRLRRWLEEQGRCYVLSAGNGSKGPRLYDWGWLPIRPWSEPDRGHWLLVRRSIADPEDLAYYACFGAGDVSLAELARVAGTRWIIEDAFKEAKQEVGLDEYQVRLWVGWHRHITLALLAHAFLAVTRSYAAGGDGKRGYVPGRTHPTDRTRGQTVTMPAAVAAPWQSHSDHPLVWMETAASGPSHAVSLPETPSDPCSTSATVILS